MPMLARLLKAEGAERGACSIACHMKTARFPACQDRAGFDFASSEIDEASVRQLHRCACLDGAGNGVPIGEQGTAKAHVSIPAIRASWALREAAAPFSSRAPVSAFPSRIRIGFHDRSRRRERVWSVLPA